MSSPAAAAATAETPTRTPLNVAIHIPVARLPELITVLSNNISSGTIHILTTRKEFDNRGGVKDELS